MAEPRDVEEVWELLVLKLEVVQWLVGGEEQVLPLPPRAELLAQVERAVDERWISLLLACGGRRVTVREAAQAIGVVQKQLARELVQRGVRPVQGYLWLPTVEMYQAQVRQQRMADEEAVEREAAAAAAETAGDGGADGEEEGGAEEDDAAEREVVCDLPVLEWQGPGEEVDPQVQQVIEGLRPKERPLYELPVVPSRFDRVIEALAELDPDRQELVYRVLLRVMRQPRLSEGNALDVLEGLRVPWAESMQEDRAVKEQVPWELGDLIEWIGQRDPEQRGLRALAVYIEAGLPELEVFADDILNAEGVTEKMKGAVRVLAAEIEEKLRVRRERALAQEALRQGAGWRDARLGLGLAPLLLIVLMLMQGAAALAGLARELGVPVIRSAQAALVDRGADAGAARPDVGLLARRLVDPLPDGRDAARLGERGPREDQVAPADAAGRSRRAVEQRAVAGGAARGERTCWVRSIGRRMPPLPTSDTPSPSPALSLVMTRVQCYTETVLKDGCPWRILQSL